MMKKIDKKLVAIVTLLIIGFSMNIIAIILAYIDMLSFFIIVLVFIAVIPIITAIEMLNTWHNKKGELIFMIIGLAGAIICFVIASQ